MGSTPTQILDFEQAVARVLGQARQACAAHPRATESLPLLATAGRILAESILADRDQPGFDRSTRDGFAITAAAWRAGATLDIIGQVRAGELWPGPPLTPGQAVEIMTGATVPAGANAVVMVEHVERTGNILAPPDGRTLAPGENIVPRGAEARLGQSVVAAGTLITAAEIGLAAACGYATLRVCAMPVVAIVATGDELVELDQQPAPQQIRNSNSYTIAALVTAAGGTPLRLAIARDLREDVCTRITEARAADLLILSGGVSMGEFDLVEEVLTDAGAQFFFTGVRMQPGRPVVFGRLPALPGASETWFFGLPGNPISTQVTFLCFAELFLRTLAGETLTSPKFAEATLAEAIEPKPGLTRLLPARLEGVSLKLTPWQGSGDLAANARANCYAELLPGKSYQTGDVIRILRR